MKHVSSDALIWYEIRKHQRRRRKTLAKIKSGIVKGLQVLPTVGLVTSAGSTKGRGLLLRVSSVNPDLHRGRQGIYTTTITGLLQAQFGAFAVAHRNS